MSDKRLDAEVYFKAIRLYQEAPDQPEALMGLLTAVCFLHVELGVSRRIMLDAATEICDSLEEANELLDKLLDEDNPPPLPIDKKDKDWN